MRELIVLATAVLVVAACTTDYPACYRGEYRGCTCADGAHGYAQCNITQDGFQGCVCDGRTPGVEGVREAGADVVEAGPAVGTYLLPCDASGKCTDGSICVDFSQRGKICTKSCKDPAECPPPAKTCSLMRGVCAPPS